jgi:putative endonuclease
MTGARSYYVYLLTNRPGGTLYCGVTNDLARRVIEHRTGRGVAFTARYNLRRLVWFEVHDDIEQAILREKRIKNWRRAWKDQLIFASNPTWRDLAAEIAGP